MEPGAAGRTGGPDRRLRTSLSAVLASRPDWWGPGGSIFLARAGDAVFRFLLFFATARLLSPADFSLYAHVTAALATAQWLLSLGAPRVALYFRALGERGGLFAWLYLLAAGASAGVAALLLFVQPLRALFFGELPSRLLLVGFAPLPFSLLSDSLGASLLAENRSRAYGATLWLRNIGTALVLAASLAASDRLAFVLGGRLVVNAAVAILTAVLARAQPDWSSVRRFAPAALRYGGPTALSSGAVALHRRADVLLLSAFGRVGEIGAYSLAAAFAEAFWLVTDSFENALFVDVARRSAAEARRETRRAVKPALWLGAAGLVLGLAAGEIAIRLFFADRYPAAASLLPWLLAATVAWGVARPFYAFLSSQGSVSTVLACNAAGRAVNVLACVVAIPRFGATGAAAACLVSYSALLVAFALAFRRSSAGRASPS